MKLKNKFMGAGFRRSASEKTLKFKNRLDFRSTFLNLPNAKHLLKEIKVIEEIQKRPKGNKLEDKYEYKDLSKISIAEISQRVCGRYYKRKYNYIESKEMPLFGSIYSETVGWSKKRTQLKLSKYGYNRRKQEILSKMNNTITSKNNTFCSNKNHSHSQSHPWLPNKTISPIHRKNFSTLTPKECHK